MCQWLWLGINNPREGLVRFLWHCISGMRFWCCWCERAKVSVLRVWNLGLLTYIMISRGPSLHLKCVVKTLAKVAVLMPHIQTYCKDLRRKYMGSVSQYLTHDRWTSNSLILKLLLISSMTLGKLQPSWLILFTY